MLAIKGYKKFKHKSYLIGVTKLSVFGYEVSIFYNSTFVVSFQTDIISLYKLIYSVLKTDEILIIKE